MARVTLWGFYQYDPTLFDGVVVPEGMDRALVIHEILHRSGDLFTYHQVPTRLKEDIANWFKMKKEDFYRLYLALTATYNPIENTDRIQETKRSYENSGSDTTTSNGSDSDVNELGVSAYNASDYTNAEKSISNGTSNNTSKLDYGAKRNETESIRTHGNIGVTTNQQMIQDEIRLRTQNNLYMMIASAFEHDFIIQVY